MSNPIITTTPVIPSVVVTDNGNVVPVQSAVWTSSDVAVAVVDNSGVNPVINPVAAGTCTISVDATILSVDGVTILHVVGTGVVNVAVVSDVLVATVNFVPITAA